MTSLSKRTFLNQLGMKNISESDVNAKINESKRIYNHSDTIVFDYLGRCLLFDGIQFQLKA